MAQPNEIPGRTRMLWGSAVLIFGFFSPAFIPLVVASSLPASIKAVLSGLLSFGIPELFIMIAVAIFGKSGYRYFKRKLRILLRRYGPPQEVSLRRYRFGLVLFCTPLIIGFLSPYVLNHITWYLDNMTIVSISLDTCLVVSFFVLGGNFWDKWRALFIYTPSRDNEDQV